ncbi:hypothetical protein [Streptomyces sp. NPDC056987]|uniref:hypothetical protein n=1 Tax=Streptomyces sp. NPDC056987 TaxID=3345988 RepID=UPI003644EDFE
MTSLMQRVRLRWAGRFAPLVGMMLMLLVPVVSIAQAVPATALSVTAPAAPAEDPCAPLKGTPAYDYCTAGEKDDKDEKPADKPEDKDLCEKLDPGSLSHQYCVSGRDKEKTEGKDPCEILKDTPTYDHCTSLNNGDSSGPLDSITGDCKAAPDLETPGDGLLGWIDAGPGTPPLARNALAQNADAYIFEQYGYAGLHWNTYDLGCGGSLRDPAAATGNTVSNWIFTWSKAWTALTVVLRQEAMGAGFLDSLDPVVENATRAVRDAVYSPWIGTSLLILGIVVIFQAKRRNVSDIMQQAVWALIVMTLATGVASYPVEASKFADETMNSVVSTVDQAFAGVDLGTTASQSAYSGGTARATPAYDPDDPKGPVSPPGKTEPERPDASTAHGNMLVHSVLYEHWLRGALGSSTSDVARKYGFQLFDAQALTWSENALSSSDRAKVIKAKKERFKELAETISKEDPTAYQHLTGKADGRISSAFTSNFASFASNMFSLASDLVIIGGRIVIRFVAILFPALAVIGLHRRFQGVVKTGLNAVAAACINVPLFATAGAIDVLCVREILAADNGMAEWLKIVLMLIISLVLWKIAKPYTRMSGMVSPTRNWMQDGGAPMGAPAKVAKTAAKAYVGHSAMRRYLGGQGRGQQGRGTAAEDVIATEHDERDAPDGTLADRPGPGGAPGPWNGGVDDPGTWWDDHQNPDLWDNQPPSGPSSPAGGTATSGDVQEPLHSAYDEPESNAFQWDTWPGSAGWTAAEQSPTRAGSDPDNWGVEDLDPAVRDSTTAVPAAAAGTEVPSPRRPALPTTTKYPELPAGDGAQTPTPTEGDLPYVQPEDDGPRVVQPTIEPDGNSVYVIFDPSSESYGVQDDRGGEQR